ncbi:hypothetical protein RHECNPAF_280074 [Rhizobium etli CNPAF512]|nr:hypothetical protein RHECNPAF_280074 [Rhizobium etli CNPAF512]
MPGRLCLPTALEKEYAVLGTTPVDLTFDTDRQRRVDTERQQRKTGAKAPVGSPI